MHELSLCRTLLRKVTQEQQKSRDVRKILTIDLEIGELTCIDAATLSFCFAAITKNTIAESAVLRCHTISAIALCQACKACYATKTLFSFCPSCESENTDLIKGNEFILTQMEVQ